jgi:hypothetical protein
VRRAVYQGGRTLVELTTNGESATRFALTFPPETAPQPGALVRLAIQDGWVLPAAGR